VAYLRFRPDHSSASVLDFHQIPIAPELPVHIQLYISVSFRIITSYRQFVKFLSAVSTAGRSSLSRRYPAWIRAAEIDDSPEVIRRKKPSGHIFSN
jgi:hypothetical protein